MNLPLKALKSKDFPQDWQNKLHFRGIQMLRALGVLYDRIITNRLEKWIKVSDAQSAFQKFRSTLHQIFTIRLLIELAKQTNTTLYIAMFDLEKAFDKVSRYKLLLKLVKMRERSD